MIGYVAAGPLGAGPPSPPRVDGGGPCRRHPRPGRPSDPRRSGLPHCGSIDLPVLSRYPAPMAKTSPPKHAAAKVNIRVRPTGSGTTRSSRPLESKQLEAGAGPEPDSRRVARLVVETAAARGRGTATRSAPSAPAPGEGRPPDSSRSPPEPVEQHRPLPPSEQVFRKESARRRRGLDLEPRHSPTRTDAGHRPTGAAGAWPGSCPHSPGGAPPRAPRSSRWAPGVRQEPFLQADHEHVQDFAAPFAAWRVIRVSRCEPLLEHVLGRRQAPASLRKRPSLS